MKSNEIALLIAAAGLYFAWRTYAMNTAAQLAISGTAAGSGPSSIVGGPGITVVTENPGYVLAPDLAY